MTDFACDVVDEAASRPSKRKCTDEITTFDEHHVGTTIREEASTSQKRLKPNQDNDTIAATASANDTSCVSSGNDEMDNPTTATMPCLALTTAAAAAAAAAAVASSTSTITTSHLTNTTFSIEMVIRLEEEIAIQESIMPLLMTRQRKILSERTIARKKLDETQERMSELLQKQSTLKAALKRQLNLRHELRTSLIKSIERLNRLEAGGFGGGVEDSKELQQQQQQRQRLLQELTLSIKEENQSVVDFLHTPTTRTSVDSGEALTNLDETEKKKDIHALDDATEEEEVARPSSCSQVSKETRAERATADVSVNPTTGELVVITRVVKEIKLNEVCNLKRKDEGLAFFNFLPCLPRAEIIRKMMDIRALEALTWDQTDSDHHGAAQEHRIESLWNTCLDFCLMNFIRPRTNQSSVASNVLASVIDFTKSSSVKIDPNETLCPFELTGVCADSSCPYQHLSPRPSNAPAITIETTTTTLTIDTEDTTNIDPNEALCPFELTSVCAAKFCPYQHLNPRPSNAPATTIKTATTTLTIGTGAKTNIDPNEALCPFELTGVCADAFCPYQHLNPRLSIPYLPREFLPLPVLKLPAKVGSTIVKTLEESQQKSEYERPKPQSANEIENVSKAKTVSLHQQPPAVDSIVTNDDFVSVPTLAVSQDFASFDESDTEVDLENWHLRNQFHHEEAEGDDVIKIQDPCQCWWMNDEDDDTNHRFEHDPNVAVGFKESLKLLGGFEVVSSKSNKSFPATIRYCRASVISTAPELIRFIGRVVDCTRLAIHAGRIDVAKSLVKQGLGVVLWMTERDDDRPESITVDTVIVLRDVLDVTKEAIDIALKYDTHQQNCLIAAFENAALLGILSTLLNNFHDHLGDRAESNQRIVQHHANFKVLLGKIREGLSSQREAESVDNGYSISHDNAKILSRCLAVLGAEQLDLPDIVGDSFDNDFRDTRLLLACFWSCQSLYHEIATSMDFHVHDFVTLESIRREAKLQLRRSRSRQLQIAIALGLVVLGCTGNVVAGLSNKQNLDPESIASLTAIDAKLCHIVSSLSDDFVDRLPLRDVFVAPLVAATTSLAILLRRYSKAQRRIDDALMSMTHVGRWKLPILAMSELLWSQLIVFQSSFPVDSQKTDKKTTKEFLTTLPHSITESHDRIAKLIASYGVYPNHVTLESDSSLHDKRNSAKKAREEIYKRVLLMPDIESCPFSRGFIRRCILKPRSTFGRNSNYISGFPQSTFLIGKTAQKFELCDCWIDKLPLSFGCHFPKLTNLSLQNNKLVCLPDSIGYLSCLQVLNVSKNKLTSLPESVGMLSSLQKLDISVNSLRDLPVSMAKLDHLEDLNGAYNSLTEIPHGVRGCKNLSVLNLSQNFLIQAKAKPSLFARYFPKLHSLKLEEQRIPEKSSSTDMILAEILEKKSSKAVHAKTAANPQHQRPVRRKAPAKAYSRRKKFKRGLS